MLLEVCQHQGKALSELKPNYFIAKKKMQWTGHAEGEDVNSTLPGTHCTAMQFMYSFRCYGVALHFVLHLSFCCLCMVARGGLPGADLFLQSISQPSRYCGPNFRILVKILRVQHLLYTFLPYPWHVRDGALPVLYTLISDPCQDLDSAVPMLCTRPHRACEVSAEKTLLSPLAVCAMSRPLSPSVSSPLSPARQTLCCPLPLCLLLPLLTRLPTPHIHWSFF